MLIDSTTQPGLGFASAAETIHIDVREPGGPVGGVLLYYAVLAYPDSSDWHKRRAFVDSMVSMRFREFVVQGARRREIPPDFRIKREKMLCGISLGGKRVERRISAGVMGWCICLNERSYRYDVPTPDGKIGLVLKGPKTVKEVIRAYLANRRSSLDPVNLEEQSAMANIAHRVWAESFPVLHIAMANPITVKIVEDQVNAVRPTGEQIARDLFDSIHQPTWLRKALEDAEELKCTLRERLGVDPADPRGLGFKPETAVRLLPTEDPLIACRFPKQSRF